MTISTGRRIIRVIDGKPYLEIKNEKGDVVELLKLENMAKTFSDNRASLKKKAGLIAAEARDGNVRVATALFRIIPDDSFQNAVIRSLLKPSDTPGVKGRLVTEDKLKSITKFINQIRDYVPVPGDVQDNLDRTESIVRLAVDALKPETVDLAEIQKKRSLLLNEVFWASPPGGYVPTFGKGNETDVELGPIDRLTLGLLTEIPGVISGHFHPQSNPSYLAPMGQDIYSLIRVGLDDEPHYIIGRGDIYTKTVIQLDENDVYRSKVLVTYKSLTDPRFSRVEIANLAEYVAAEKFFAASHKSTQDQSRRPFILEERKIAGGEFETALSLFNDFLNENPALKNEFNKFAPKMTKKKLLNVEDHVKFILENSALPTMQMVTVAHYLVLLSAMSDSGYNSVLGHLGLSLNGVGKENLERAIGDLRKQVLGTHLKSIFSHAASPQ